MSRTVDIITGVVIGGIVWVILDFILSPIPILGWIIAAVVAGYIAGRLGGWWAGFILAIITPLASFIIGEAVLSYASSVISSTVPELAPLWNMVSGILGSLVATYAILSAIINFMFVGFGTSLGASSYDKSKNKGTSSNRKASTRRPPPTAQNRPYSNQNNLMYSLSGLDRFIIERFMAGASLEQIALESGVSIFDIQSRFIDLMNKGLIRIQLNKLELQILNAAKTGINIKQIAMQTGVSENYIIQEINRLRAMSLLDNNLRLTPLGYHILASGIY